MSRHQNLADWGEISMLCLQIKKGRRFTDLETDPDTESHSAALLLDGASKQA